MQFVARKVSAYADCTRQFMMVELPGGEAPAAPFAREANTRFRVSRSFALPTDPFLLARLTGAARHKRLAKSRQPGYARPAGV